MALYLSESDVQSLIAMPKAIEVVEEAFRRLAAGEATNEPRVRAINADVVVHTMSATARWLGAAGWKCYASSKAGTTFHVGLYDTATASLTALLAADLLGRFRTGAATGVAVKHLSAPETTEVTVIGAGKQARTQLMAVAAVRPIRQAKVHSRSPQLRSNFAAELSKALEVDVVPVPDLQEAAKEAPIIITATTSAQPVVMSDWVRDDALVCAVGANWTRRREIDPLLVQRCQSVVCDDIFACRAEAGDLVLAAEEGCFDWSRAIDLATVVTAGLPASPRSPSAVLFKSVGLAIEDVVLGRHLVELARQRGVGTELEL